MALRTLFTGTFCLALMGSTPSMAQDAKSQAAAGALSGYAMIKAFAGACKFDIEPPIAQVLDANIKALVTKFNIPAGVPDQMIKEHGKQFIGVEQQSCVWGPDKFNAMISQMAAEPLAAATQAGVDQAQIPASKLPLSSFPADAAPGPKDKAVAGIAGYLTILAVSKVCNFTLNPAMMQTVVANINALQPKSELADKDIDRLLENIIPTMEKAKQTFCTPGEAVFNSTAAPELAKAAVTQAEGSGISLKPVTPSASTTTAPAAKAASAPAVASGLIAGTDAEGIADIMKKYGEISLTKDKDGDPLIKGKSKGAPWSISFFGCEKGTNCTSFEFYYGLAAATKPTQAKINEWNQKKRWSKAYIDKDGDPNITFDVTLTGGVSSANIDALTSRWVDTVEEFRGAFSSK